MIGFEGSIRLAKSIDAPAIRALVRDCYGDSLPFSYSVNLSQIGRQIEQGDVVYALAFDERGRHVGQAPDIDGLTYITDGTASPGDLVPVRIEQANDYDIAGAISEPATLSAVS